MLELFQHIQKANTTLTGELAFANDWDFFMSDPSVRLENLVSTGPYAGTLEAFATGVKLRTRYEHLLDQALAHNQTSFWASSSKRVVETAGYFGAGFFGLDWKQLASLHVIPETEDRGGNTLTAGKTCFKYLHNADEYGRAHGYRKWNEWREVYLPAIVERLNKRNSGITFSQDEVYSMQELCGFELIATGKSKWCDVFTHEQWEHFEYARDVLHYYRTGPGNPYSGTMGWLWLNATVDLLTKGPAETGPLFFSLYVTYITLHITHEHLLTHISPPASTTATSSPCSPPSISSHPKPHAYPPPTSSPTAPSAPPTSYQWAAALSSNASPVRLRKAAGTKPSTGTLTCGTASRWGKKSTLSGSTSMMAS